jgi:hypothetical protein
LAEGTYLKEIKTPNVLKISGKRLPNLSNNSLLAEHRLLYYQYVQILFKPFRSLADLIQEQSWENAFNLWVPTKPAKKYMAYNKDYYTAKNDKSKDDEYQYYCSLENDLTNDNINWDSDDTTQTNLAKMLFN